MLKVVEAFSGLGSQNKALDQIKNSLGIKYKVLNTIEWDINAIYAYDIIHNGEQKLEEYSNVSDDEILDFLMNKELSLDGHTPMTHTQLLKLSKEALRSLYISVKRTNNLVSIKQVKASDFKEEVDIFTYSFPCQDLSVSGYFHGDKGGISRDADNSSSMLWEVERILLEFYNEKRNMPKFLLMENVASITSKRHIDHFNEWKKSLEDMGYISDHFILDAKDFGIPQRRRRTFMISTYFGTDLKLKELIKKRYEESDMKNLKLDFNKKDFSLKNYLKDDYSNEEYRIEALEQNPNDTKSRRKILGLNPIIMDENKKIKVPYVRTLTTKQDRHPNSGVIMINKTELGSEPQKSNFRYLTPRESFLLMGYEESDFEALIKNNLILSPNRVLLTKSKLTKLAGNSIVVPVIKEVFHEMINIKAILDNHYNKKGN